MSENGIALFFEANGKMVVTVAVSTQDISQRCATQSLTITIFLSLALYEADRKAHEEAVQNGGVSFHSCYSDFR